MGPWWKSNLTIISLKINVLGGTTHGTNSSTMATRLHFEDRSSRITSPNAHERKHEIDSTS